jgi:uncharacterized protein
MKTAPANSMQYLRAILCLAWRSVCFGIPLVFAAQAFSASFDCAHATTSTEKMICADTVLSKLDEQLATIYQMTLNDLPDDHVTHIRQDQRDWLITRNACGTDSTCLQDGMKRRIKVFETLANEGKEGLDCVIATILTHPADAAIRLRTWRNGLASAWLAYLHQC